jgi:hypothetical protein
MQFLIENWFLIVVAVAVISVAAHAVYAFMKRPTDAQLSSVKEWLLWACTEAEKELGGGTGKLKLRYVYNSFLSIFPALSKIITFDMISDLVTEVLVDMREILATNNSASAYVYGTDTAATTTTEDKEE